MSTPVKDVTELKPIVEKMVRLLYGESVDNIEIVKPNHPLFSEPKQGWLVYVRFNGDRYEYMVQMYIHKAYGRITRSLELYRTPLENRRLHIYPS